MSDRDEAGSGAAGRWPSVTGEAAPDGYVGMIASLRGFLDTLAGAAPDAPTVAAIDAAMRDLTARLGAFGVGEFAQPFGRVYDVAGRGQTMAPAYEMLENDGTSMRATVVFGRYFLGGNGAVHGGAIALLLDEVLGLPANADPEVAARTARLEVNYRAITPIDVPLEVSARLVSVDGRKRVVRAELRHGDTLCAEAEGLFVALLPGQQ